MKENESIKNLQFEDNTMQFKKIIQENKDIYNTFIANKKINNSINNKNKHRKSQDFIYKNIILNKILNKNDRKGMGKNKNNISIKNEKNKSILLLNNNSSKKIKNLKKKLELQKLHPFRKLNLNVIEAGLQQKIIDMSISFSNLDNTVFTYELKDKHNEPLNITQPSLNYNSQKNFYDNIKIQKKYDNNEINKSRTINENINYFNKKFYYEDLSSRKIFNNSKINKTQTSIEINKIKKNQSISIDNINKKIEQFRMLEHKPNIYDSLDDNESDEDLEPDGNYLSPDSNFIFLFDLILLIISLYIAFYIPLKIANEKCFCKLSKISLNDFILFFTDFIFIVDIPLTFFRGYYTNDYKIVKNNYSIFTNYIFGNFWISLLESIPFFTINEIKCNFNINSIPCFQFEMSYKFLLLKFSLIFKVFKLFKIRKNKKNSAIDRLLNIASENYKIEKISEFFINFIVYFSLVHTFICLNIFLGNNTFPNWLITNNTDNSFISVYFKSFYFLIATMTTIGYGDIVPLSLAQRIFQIIVLGVGIVFYSFVISSIGNSIKIESRAKIKFNNDLNLLEDIRIKYPSISFQLYKNIIKYLEKRKKSEKKCDVNILANSLPYSLKNNILLTLYHNVIKNFSFFKSCENSDFIMQVLTNFIPTTAKKNEILVYEGDIIEEMIFIKDGRLSLDAVLNLDDISFSIEKYFQYNFIIFNKEEEKKICQDEENNLDKNELIILNNNTRKLTYKDVKAELNNIFKTKYYENEKLSLFSIADDNSIIELNKFNKYYLNGNTIKNEDGNYHYLKILDIRKHEHLGCVHISLQKPAPLSLQVRTKIAELFLLKKDIAMKISKSYPNIWKKLLAKEFHNFMTIKKLTFRILKSYLKWNEIKTNFNISEGITANNIDSFMNTIEYQKEEDKYINIKTKKKKSKFSVVNITNDKSLPYIKRHSNLNISRSKIIEKKFINSPINKYKKKNKKNKNHSINKSIPINKNKEENINLNKTLNIIGLEKENEINIITLYNECFSNPFKEYIKKKIQKNIKKEKLFNYLKKIINKNKIINNTNIESKKKISNNQINYTVISKSVPKLQKKIFNECKEKKKHRHCSSVRINEDLYRKKILIKNISNSSNENLITMTNLTSLYNNKSERHFNLAEFSIKSSSFEIKKSYTNLNKVTKGIIIKNKEFQKDIKKYALSKIEGEETIFFSYESNYNSNNDISINTQNKENNELKINNTLNLNDIKTFKEKERSSKNTLKISFNKEDEIIQQNKITIFPKEEYNESQNKIYSIIETEKNKININNSNTNLTYCINIKGNNITNKKKSIKMKEPISDRTSKSPFTQNSKASSIPIIMFKNINTNKEINPEIEYILGNKNNKHKSGFFIQIVNQEK